MNTTRMSLYRYENSIKYFCNVENQFLSYRLEQNLAETGVVILFEVMALRYQHILNGFCLVSFSLYCFGQGGVRLQSSSEYSDISQNLRKIRTSLSGFVVVKETDSEEDSRRR